MPNENVIEVEFRVSNTEVFIEALKSMTETAEHCGEAIAKVLAARFEINGR